ncbi:ATP-dependent DNA helicase DinG [Cohnella pontilimi]|uniref:3'-5' exonuclease DinG n=1 Tax=Cohnella pontilimi TaxID=2564100 RepID=A0A4U0FL70_9BACL|nr:ATP-dependent DNA helicase DinG [Cohnella pontilimi]TJY44312.1 ATP-dependent DNA helicase DinG [Cohnella pontilimi]
MKFAVLDFETTGISSDKDEIIQAGLAVVDEAGSVFSTFSSYVRPDKPIPAEITRLTGITEDDVREAPQLEDVLADMVPLLQDAVLVGHNVEFDAKFLQTALDRSGYLPFTGRMLDTVDLTRLLYPTLPSYQLSSLTQWFGIGHERPHQADSDALATAELLRLGIDKLRSLPLLTLQRLGSLFNPDSSDLGWLIALTLQEREIRPALSEEGYYYHRQFAMKVGDWNEDNQPAGEQAPAETARKLEQMPFNAFAEEVRGRLKELLPAYEEREGQNLMAGEVLEALEHDSHLLVEAGTGTGKSLGYLLPSLYYGLRESKKIVVTTHTIQLQEQLRQRDLPLLQEVLPVPFKAAVFKGRNNYMCLRKFEGRVSVPDYALGPEEAVSRGAMTVWLSETSRGEGEELNLGRHKDEWDAVASDAASCLNRSCPWFHKCFYHRARNEAMKSDLIITNHALVFTDLRAEHRLLPSYDKLIVDEAHHLEDVASQHLGQKTGYTSLSVPLQRLWRDARTGLMPQLTSALSSASHPHAAAWAEKAEAAASGLHEIREAWDRWTEALYGLLASNAAADESGNFTLRLKPDDMPSGWETIRVDGDNVIQLLSDFIRPMEKLSAEVREETDEYAVQALLTDLGGVIKDLAGVRADMGSFVTLGEKDYVYWVEGHYQYKGRSVWMYGVPADVSGLLKERLFDRKESVIMTSATLTVDKSFQYVTESLGLASAEKDGRLRTAVVPSPFRYREQALVLIPRNFPTIKGRDGDPNFLQALTDSLRDVVSTVGGRTLVLFTSHRMLKSVYGPLKESLEASGIQVLGQGVDSSSRSRLTKQFREQPASVLLGTSSFWEGVDLPGDALTCLAIVRLPFQPPNHPVVEAKSEKLQAEKKNPFMKLSLPQAVIRFKQGFGRLVRTTSDRGIVILYDTRVLDTNYGKYFLYSLPGPKMEHLPTAGMADRVRDWLAPQQPGEGGETE